MERRNTTAYLFAIACIMSVMQVSLTRAAPVTQLKIMSFNVWHGGSNVNDGLNKIVSAIQMSGADIVGMEESEGAAAQVAAALGWYSYQPANSVAIVSRYPITETFPLTLNNAGTGVRIQLNADPPQDVIFWGAHLTAFPYGPYSACLDGDSVQQILRDERQNRVKEINSILNAMQSYIADADNIPVVLTGDFNSPSHLDWIPAAAGLHCGYTITWPVTVNISDGGLIDAYRLLHPDPVADPANTWSPIYGTFVHPDGTPEPLDRIDMVHFAGAGATATAASVFVVGNPSQYPNHENNQWPSDHASVLVDFDLVPGGGVIIDQPELTLDKTIYAPGENIVATFANGPGNTADWIGLFNTGDIPGQAASQAWFYTNNSQAAGGNGPADGSVTFDNTSGPTWPLPEGSYDAYFLCCDGFDVLNGPVAFTVSGSACSPASMHVDSIVTATQNAGQGKKFGKATVTILNDCGNPVANASVSGTFTGDVTGSDTAATDSNGKAVLLSTTTAAGAVHFTFCVDNVTGSLPYDSAANVETCDSQ